MDQLRAMGEWVARRKYLSAFIFVLLVSAGVGARFVTHASSGQLSEPIQKGRIVDAVYGIGTVTATHRRSYNPLVGDTLGSIFVKEGDFVKKGHLIAVSTEGNRITAPFDGIVNYLPYRAGENAYPTSPMIVFTDMADRYVVVSMEQQGALRVKIGQTAKLSFDSLRKKTFEGRVSAVYSYSNNFLARIDSVDLPDSILPDMTCDVAITIDTHEEALLIPVVAFDNGKVWVKRGHGLPHAVPVELGVVDGAKAEVVSGDIRAGDRVLIRPKAGP